MKRQKLFLYIILSTILCLSGCKVSSYFPSKAEIENLEFIRILGIDKSPQNPEEIRVTMLYMARESQPGGKAGGNSDGDQKGEASKIRTVVWEGRTVSEAIKGAQMISERQIFLGHVFAVIIGDEAAREGITKYIDFISRGMELRLNNNVYIAKGSTAEDLIVKSSQSGKSLPDTIEHFQKNYEATSTSGSLKLIELMGKLDRENNGIFIPALKIVAQESDSAQGGEKGRENIVIELDGYGIIKGHMLIGYVDKQLSSAINILNNKYVSGDIIVSDPYGYAVTLEVIEMHTKKEYKFNGDDIESVMLNIIVNSNVGEQHSNKNIYDKASLEYLFEQQADAVKDSVYSIVEYAQKHNVDVLGFGKSLFQKHPVKWERIKDDWDSIFPNLKVDIDVKSRILRTYDITQPNSMEDMK